MSAPMSRRRLLWLLPVIVTGVCTLLASSTFEDKPPDQTTSVDWLLGSLPAPLVRDRGDRTATITNLRIAGTYEATTGDDLTLDRDRTPIDTTSGFDMELVADDPEDDHALSGSLQMRVLAELDFGLDEDPTTGQFSIVADGTTTLVTAQTDPNVAVVVTGGGTTQNLEWGDFRGAADDDQADHQLRLASEAFNTISEIVKLARLGESLISETEDNRDTLENMGLDAPLNLTCDSSGVVGQSQGESVLIWRIDAAGSDQGSIGNGDSLEARFENCFNSASDRFLDGTIVMDDYQPPRGDAPRTLGLDLDLATFFFAEAEVTITTVPDKSSPRVDGGLEILYDESLVTTTP
jgi:hypothetical protein